MIEVRVEKTHDKDKSVEINDRDKNVQNL